MQSSGVLQERAACPLAVRARLSRKAGHFDLDVDLQVGRGITVVFGPSGSGKSTILSIVAGLLMPDAGRVSLGGDVWHDSETRKHHPIHDRRVAFVFQSLGLFPHLTALANVEFGVDRALSKSVRRERARASLARFRGEHLADRRPKTFSGGEGQRVALARAFAMTPRVMLLDEPFSALDAALRAEFVHDLKSFSSELQIPILHVTHDRAEAAALADTVILLERGRVTRVGLPQQVLAGATNGALANSLGPPA